MDYPSVSCESCREMEEVDGIIPPCKTTEGCWIPPLTPAGSRALEIHGKLKNLKDLGLSARICDIYEVTVSDLELLAVIENEINNNRQQSQGEGNGDGS